MLDHREAFYSKHFQVAIISLIFQLIAHVQLNIYATCPALLRHQGEFFITSQNRLFM